MATIVVDLHVARSNIHIYLDMVHLPSTMVESTEISVAKFSTFRSEVSTVRQLNLRKSFFAPK
eukprot:SAG11_NODE_113_length_16061_cov_16.161143_3_plen_63_part_00